MRIPPYALLVLVFVTAPAFANVTVSSPSNGETVTSPATFVATANTTTCSKGVGAMGIYVDNQLEYVVNATSMNTTLTMTPGSHNAVVQEWDQCGGATKTAVPVTVVNNAGVWVTAPVNNATVTPLNSFVATATTACAKGVSSMGIYVNGQRVYVVNGAKLNTELTLPTGAVQAVIEEWDGCGGAATSAVTLNVQATGTGTGTAKEFTDLQKDAWRSWGQEAPLDEDCGYPCPGETWSMQTGVKLPSLSGDATEFSLGGTKPYSDVLFYNQLIGVGSTQGLPDTNRTLIPTLHHFKYQTAVYVANASVTQALEFDVNMFFNGVGMTFGTECRIEGGNEWDIWDNAAAHWVPTGVACNPVNNAWNHVTIDVQRDANNNLTFNSITLNGQTAVINKTYGPFPVPDSWYGVVCDFQMDGNYAQNAFNTYLDNTTFTYW
jgi:hypothetical protein